MSGGVFFDTNILLYQFDNDSALKQTVARERVAKAWRERNGLISYQVLNEFMVNMQRKVRDPVQVARARADVIAFAAWNPVVTDRALLEHAWKLQDRYQFSYWDAQIVAAALRAEAATLLSEDMHAGLTIPHRTGELTWANPFVLGIAQVAATYEAAPTLKRSRGPKKPIRQTPR